MVSEKEALLLKRIARDSIQRGLEYAEPLGVDASKLPSALKKIVASFVTLYDSKRQLRGCIGSLEAYRPLAVDVAHNAFAAAFSDPRFFPLTEREFVDLSLHISLLIPAIPMQFTSEEDLIAQLRPHIDGLVLEDRGYRGTFLPSVWESLPTPREFLKSLKLKAGLPSDNWSETIKVSRYTTEVIE